MRPLTLLEGVNSNYRFFHCCDLLQKNQHIVETITNQQEKCKHNKLNFLYDSEPPVPTPQPSALTVALLIFLLFRHLLEVKKHLATYSFISNTNTYKYTIENKIM